MESGYLPSGGGVPRFCWLFNLSSALQHGRHMGKVLESHQGAVRRGRKSQHLVVAEKEGKEWGSRQHLEHQQGVAERDRCHCSATKRASMTGGPQLITPECPQKYFTNRGPVVGYP